MTENFSFYPAGFTSSEDFCGTFDSRTMPLSHIQEDTLFSRGYAVVDIMEAKNGVVFHEEDHLERICNSIRLLRMNIPKLAGPGFSEFKIFLKRAIQKALFVNFPKKPFSAWVWIFVGGGPTFNSFNPVGDSSLFIRVADFNSPEFEKGKALKLMAVEHLREFPEAKTNNYAFPESMIPILSSAGSDDLLYVHKGGFLEAARSNFFVVTKKRGGKIALKTAKDNVLHGITRKVVLELAKNKGYEVKEGKVSLKDVLSADEAFVASTTKFVWPVARVNLGEVAKKRISLVSSTQEKNFGVGPVALGLRKTLLEYREGYYKQRS